MAKTIAEINERIKTGKAVVLNALDMAKLVKDLGKKKAAAEVDVVTTGTFSPMCSSGLLFNFGQPEAPLVKASTVTLNDVPCYAGLAAVDAYLGVTEPKEGDPLNTVRPGRFEYGGGHVIEDLVRGKSVRLKATAYGTDCYPRKSLERDYTLAELPFAELLNPRNGYQNYNVAINEAGKTIYTYMGPLKPKRRNVNFATAGALSPLLNDPYFLTIGLGTKIFLGGGVGWVMGPGTQHTPNPPRNARGVPTRASGTLMVKGDLKGMNAEYLRGVSFAGYGCSLAVGLGIPIPILDERIAWFAGVDHEDILMPVKDYALDYPQGRGTVQAEVSYAELLTGKVKLGDETVEAVPMTSLSKSLEIADELKRWIDEGRFLLSEPQELLPSDRSSLAD